MSDIAIKYANYAERRIMWVTPNEAKRLGVKGCCSSATRHSVGMYRLVEWNKVFGHFLPSEAFLTECRYHSSSGNSVGVQPASGLRERVCIFSAPNRFASLEVTHIQPFGFDGRFFTPLRCVRNDAQPIDLHVSTNRTSSFNHTYGYLSTLRKVGRVSCARLKGSVAQGCKSLIYSLLKRDLKYYVLINSNVFK